MTDEEATKEIIDEMCWIQELIEKYLKFYMTKKEIVYVLTRGAKIDPSLTEIVWRNLEKENMEFFRAYRTRLAVKNQIEQFNALLEKQAALMSQTHPASASTPLTNESQCNPMDDNTIHQVALFARSSDARPSENMDQAVQTMHNVYTNGASPFRPSMQAYRDTSDPNGLDNNVLVQSLNREPMQGMNVDVIKSEQNTAKITVGDNSGAPQCGNAFMQEPKSLVYTCDEPTNGQSMDFSGLLRHDFPRNVSLSDLDLTADFFTSNGMLENHYRSPFPNHTSEFLGQANQRTMARHSEEQP